MGTCGLSTAASRALANSARPESAAIGWWLGGVATCGGGAIARGAIAGGAIAGGACAW